MLLQRIWKGAARATGGAYGSSDSAYRESDAACGGPKVFCGVISFVSSNSIIATNNDCSSIAVS